MEEKKKYIDLVDRLIRDPKFRLNCLLMFALLVGVVAFWPQMTWYYPPTLAEQIIAQLPIILWMIICVILAIVGKKLIKKKGIEHGRAA